MKPWKPTLHSQRLICGVNTNKTEWMMNMNYSLFCWTLKRQWYWRCGCSIFQWSLEDKHNARWPLFELCAKRNHLKRSNSRFFFTVSIGNDLSGKGGAQLIESLNVNTTLTKLDLDGIENMSDTFNWCSCVNYYLHHQKQSLALEIREQESWQKYWKWTLHSRNSILVVSTKESSSGELWLHS